MNNKIILFAVLFIIVVSIAYVWNTQKKEQNDPVNHTAPFELTFEAIPTAPLATIELNSNWILSYSTQITDIAGKEEVSIEVYTTEDGKNTLILNDRSNLYDMNFVYEGEPKDINLTTKDTNQNNNVEILASNDLGAIVRGTKIYSYINERWECLLSAENLIFSDLNRDGTDELLTESMGSLPGYVWVYRWTGSQFAYSDVGKSLGSEYAALITENDHILIEAGPDGITKRYSYEDGGLIEQ